MSTTRQPKNNRISAQFSARLARLGRRKRVRAIVMLETGKTLPAGRRSVQTRLNTLRVIRKSAASALTDIDKILQRFHGKRLVHEVDALGSVPVETTAAGINALAQSAHVKAILEDQPVSLLR